MSALFLARLGLMEAPILLIFCYLFCRFFAKVDSDPNLTLKKQMYMSFIFVGFFLLLGTVAKSLLSDIASYAYFIIMLYLASKASA